MKGQILEIEGQVYEVFFDGVHTGRDEDLLRSDLKIADKRPATELRPARPLPGVDPCLRVLAVAAVTPELVGKPKWLSLKELARLTTLTVDQVNSAMARLLAEGRVHRQPRSTVRRNQWGRGHEYEYRLTRSTESAQQP